jgi:predicted nucleic acid-binding protein
MKFWDSSALVALCVEQPSSGTARAAYAEDPDVVAWWGSSIECASAIARLHRDGHLSAPDERLAREILDEFRQGWFEVQPGESVRVQALRLLRVHALRAADALQLAAAMEWSGFPAHGTVVTFDDRLRDAARREGFTA